MPRSNAGRYILYVFLAFAVGFWLSWDLWKMVFYLPGPVKYMILGPPLLLFGWVILLRYLMWRDSRAGRMSDIKNAMEELEKAKRHSKENGKAGEDKIK